MKNIIKDNSENIIIKLSVILENSVIRINSKILRSKYNSLRNYKNIYLPVKFYEQNITS